MSLKKYVFKKYEKMDKADMNLDSLMYLKGGMSDIENILMIKFIIVPTKNVIAFSCFYRSIIQIQDSTFKKFIYLTQHGEFSMIAVWEIAVSTQVT